LPTTHSADWPGTPEDFHERTPARRNSGAYTTKSTPRVNLEQLGAGAIHSQMIFPRFGSPLTGAEDRHHTAKAQFIPVFDWRGSFRRQLLPIHKGAVGAVLVLKHVLIAID
jgi:hypothetical protein